MKEYEAIERIKDHIKIHRLEEQRAIYLTDAFAIAINALKKQIPKKPFKGYIPRDLAVNCGSCNLFIGFSDQTNRYNYCPNCGQAIKWE